jgi:ubiquinone biosynthesis protein COQ4
MMTAMIDRAFAQDLLHTFNDPGAHGVHLLFNKWWQHAPEAAIAKYVADFEKNPGQKAFLDAHYFAPPLDLDDLAILPAGTLGRDYHDFIVLNGLEKNIATNYAQFHDMLAASGQLDRMPEALRYAIIRGFQVHDLMHVLSGYPASPAGEIALQAFCLAQIRFPYFAMWMSVVTTRMALLDPDQTIPMMNAITDGWQFGRSAKNIQFEPWETMFDRPTATLRTAFGLDRPLTGASVH